MKFSLLKSIYIDKEYKRLYRNIFYEILKESPNSNYDETAMPSYTHKNNFISWFFWKRIDAAFLLAGDIYGKTVLDFGCGGGVTFKYLNDCNCRVTGCDTNTYFLLKGICTKLALKAQLYKDLFAIKNQEFDIIFALDVLEHIENINLVINKLLELSHDDTLLIVSGPTENLFYKIGRLLAGFSGHYHLRTVFDIEEILKKRQLDNIISGSLYSPFPIFRITSWRKSK